MSGCRTRQVPVGLEGVAALVARRDQRHVQVGALELHRDPVAGHRGCGRDNQVGVRQDRPELNRGGVLHPQFEHTIGSHAPISSRQARAQHGSQGASGVV